MRLSVLVTGEGRGPTPSREAKETSRKLSDVVRKRWETAPPGPDASSHNGDSAEGPSTAPEEAAKSPGTVIRPGETEGPLKDPQAADHLIQRAVDAIEKILQEVETNASFSISSAEAAVENLVQSLEASDALLLPFFRAGGPSLNPAREAVNVCLLSVKMGLELGYAPERLRKLGLAALLCDLGLARVPVQILGKPGGVTPDDRAVLENTQREWVRCVQKQGREYGWLAEVLEKKSEKFKDPGQPENETEEYAAIIRLADICESLVHHRPFRPGVGTLGALKKILLDERKTFPDRIFKALIRILSSFPVGSLVLLNTGEIGRVVAKNKDLPLRPVVEIVVRRGKPLEEPVVIDLRQNPLHYIQDSVLEEVLA